MKQETKYHHRHSNHRRLWRGWWLRKKIPEFMVRQLCAMRHIYKGAANIDEPYISTKASEDQIRAHIPMESHDAWT